MGILEQETHTRHLIWFVCMNTIQLNKRDVGTILFYYMYSYKFNKKSTLCKVFIYEVVLNNDGKKSLVYYWIPNGPRENYSKVNLLRKLK